MHKANAIDERAEADIDAQSYAQIARAISYLRARHVAQPELADLARHLGLSTSHTQRLFSRWAGISPKRFVQFLTVEHAKHCMSDTGDLMRLSLDSGLSGPGRLHDLFVGFEAMSPGEFRCAAAGLSIVYGIGDTPFGPALVAFTGRGICHLSFVDDSPPAQWFALLKRQWPEAVLARDDAAANKLLIRVFSHTSRSARAGLSLWVSGTNFQIQVWRALMQVPFAGLLSYRQIAGLIGRPKAARAVGSAIARNPVAFLIPCHRILRETGDFGIYHWGTERKAALCAWESAAIERSPSPKDSSGG